MTLLRTFSSFRSFFSVFSWSIPAMASTGKQTFFFVKILQNLAKFTIWKINEIPWKRINSLVSFLNHKFYVQKAYNHSFQTIYRPDSTWDSEYAITAGATHMFMWAYKKIVRLKKCQISSRKKKQKVWKGQNSVLEWFCGKR